MCREELSVCCLSFSVYSLLALSLSLSVFLSQLKMNNPASPTTISPTCLPLCLPPRPSVCLHVCHLNVIVYPSICLYICLSLRLLSVCLPPSLSVPLSVCLHECLSACLNVRLSLSVFMSESLSACLSGILIDDYNRLS